MKKNILFLLAALFAAATVLTSCDSKDEPTPPPVTDLSLSAAGSFMIADFKYTEFD